VTPDLDSLLLHDKTKAQLNQIVEQPVQGILMTGHDGYGKKTIAKALLAKILGKLTDANLLIITANDMHNIGIEKIKEIKDFVKLKTIGTSEYRRAILVVNGEYMTTEAQNALLKTLEEPPSDTLIVITASQPKLLLPTIRSRVTEVHILPVTTEQIISYYADQFTPEEIKQASLIGNGAAGLTHALLHESEDHQLAMAVQEAKTILTESPFLRLSSVDALAKDKNKVRLMLDALARIGRATMTQVAGQHKTRSVEAWQKRLELIHETHEYIDKNVSTKLMLTNLFLNL